MEKRDYSSGYTDFNYDVAEEVNEAHHLRYVKTPSGRKLYLLGSVDQDAAEIEEIRTVTAACNAWQRTGFEEPSSAAICELEERAAEIRKLKANLPEQQRKYDALLCRKLANEKPYCDQPWARMALFIAANAIERGRLLSDAEKNENLAAAFDEDGDHELAEKIRATRA